MALGAGRISKELKLSWPGMGERVKNCCCIIGSTEAATEFVESATLRNTLTAIQSLKDEDISNGCEVPIRSTYSRNSFKIWNAPKAGSLRIVCEAMFRDVVKEKTVEFLPDPA